VAKGSSKKMQKQQPKQTLGEFRAVQILITCIIVLVFWNLLDFILDEYVFHEGYVFEFYYEKTRLVMIATTTSAVLNIILNYIFIGIFGYTAAGYTTLACYIIYASFHYLFMRKICNDYLDGEQPYKLNIILGITGVFLLCGFLFLLTYNHPVIRYSILVILIAAMIIKRNTIITFLKNMLALKKER
jgi:peptidoglycan biosynthesis protein MviN/MurJ (putative lipid II flippase)